MISRVRFKSPLIFADFVMNADIQHLSHLKSITWDCRIIPVAYEGLLHNAMEKMYQYFYIDSFKISGLEEIAGFHIRGHKQVFYCQA